jgi:hypothetical protein
MRPPPHPGGKGMTFYSLWLFAHIGAAFFLFAGLALEGTVVSFLRRNPDQAQSPAWTQLASVAPRLYGPAIGVILVSGGYLATKIKGWEEGWVRVSFVTLIVIGLIGVVFTASRARAIRKLLADKSAITSAELQTRLQDPVLLASVRLRVALVLGVLLLMASKVSLNTSLIVIACATALGLVIALPAWRCAPQPQTIQ